MSMKLRWMDGYATPGFFLRVSLVGPVWGELRLSDLREALLRGLRVERRLRSLVTGRPRSDVSFMVRSVYGAHFPLKAVFIFVSVQEPRCMSVRVCSNYPKKWVPLSERCPELSLVIPKSGPLVSRMSEMATWSAGGASDETTPSPVRGLAAQKGRAARPCGDSRQLPNRGVPCSGPVVLACTALHLTASEPYEPCNGPLSPRKLSCVAHEGLWRDLL